MRKGVRQGVRMTGLAVALGWAGILATSAVTAGVLTLGTPGMALAQGFGSATPDRFFRVEAEAGTGRGGRPVVRGYIYNDYGQAAGRILLQVETLDAGGQVVARNLIPADGIAPPFSRLYFDGPVSASGARYRVTVYYFEWQGRGGAGN